MRLIVLLALLLSACAELTPPPTQAAVRTKVKVVYVDRELLPIKPLKAQPPQIVFVDKLVFFAYPVFFPVPQAIPDLTIPACPTIDQIRVAIATATQDMYQHFPDKEHPCACETNEYRSGRKCLGNATKKRPPYCDSKLVPITIVRRAWDDMKLPPECQAQRP